MARIDRRVSTNQTALWTAYELISIQARRVRAAVRTAPRGDDRLITFGRKLAPVLRAARRLITRVRILTAPLAPGHLLA